MRRAISAIGVPRSRSREKAQGPPIPAEVRAGEMHSSICFAPLLHGQLRRAGQRARPVRVLSARLGADRRRVRTAGDAEDGDDKGRADPGDGSRPLPVDRRMPLLTLTVLATFAWEAPMRADDARGEPHRHLARLELSAEREHLAAALAFVRSETSRLGLGRDPSLATRAFRANRPGRAPSGPSHSERLAGLGMLAERLRYRFCVVRHVHHTLLVDPLIALTPMRRGLIAGAGC